MSFLATYEPDDTYANYDIVTVMASFFKSLQFNSYTVRDHVYLPRGQKGKTNAMFVLGVTQAYTL